MSKDKHLIGKSEVNKASKRLMVVLVVTVAFSIIIGVFLFEKSNQKVDEKKLIEETHALIHTMNKVYTLENDEEIEKVIEESFENPSEYKINKKFDYSQYERVETEFSDDAIRPPDLFGVFKVTTTVKQTFYFKNGKVGENETRITYEVKEVADGEYRIVDRYSAE